MNLDTAIKIASAAHHGQVDKGDQPYILHPIRLMQKFEQQDLKILAMLHDVVEDSDVTLEELEKEGFEPHILDALDCLTRRKGEEYDQFIDLVKQNELATKVKIKDMEDNLSIYRLKILGRNEFKRIRKYDKFLKILKEDTKHERKRKTASINGPDS